nr:immunoglobulin light chain junction region [Macaca mulatta]MOY06734.1 immunoglobulin light chain junction region [Macaca mulatta]
DYYCMTWYNNAYWVF